MADSAPRVTRPATEVAFDRDRVALMMATLENMAAGEVGARLPISPLHDELDAIAYAINALVGELGWASARTKEAQEARAAELTAAIANAEARNSAILQAIPDLMFVLDRHGTYLDFHAHDPKQLFVPPEAFLGRNVRDVLPPMLVERTLDAIERVCQGENLVMIEYELLMGEPRVFETRLVRAGADRVLSMVRDVTDARRAAERIHDLAQRLVASQEKERQRIARELHDDISQRLALLNVEIDQMATQASGSESCVRLRQLSAQVGEIARAVHDLSYELHPLKLQAFGLAAAIESLCQDAEQRQLHVAFTHAPLPSSVDPGVSLSLYRIAQEALHNVARHSQARQAQVNLTCEDGHIALHIADSGVGFDPKQISRSGLGLVSMQERVALVNGHLAIHAAPGAGTRIDVRVPVATDATGFRPRLASL